MVVSSSVARETNPSLSSFAVPSSIPSTVGPSRGVGKGGGGGSQTSPLLAPDATPFAVSSSVSSSAVKKSKVATTRKPNEPHTPLATRGKVIPPPAASKDTDWAIPPLPLTQSSSLSSVAPPVFTSLPSTRAEAEENGQGTGGGKRLGHTVATVGGSKGGGPSRAVPPAAALHAKTKESPPPLREEPHAALPRHNDPHAGIPASTAVGERGGPMSTSPPLRVASLVTTPRTPRQPPRRVLPSSSVAQERTEGAVHPPPAATRAAAPPTRESKSRVLPTSHSNVNGGGTGAEWIARSRQKRGMVAARHEPEEEEEDDVLLVEEEEEGVGWSPMPRPIADDFVSVSQRQPVERLGGVGQLHRPRRAGPPGSVPSERSLLSTDLISAASPPLPPSTLSSEEKRRMDREGGEDNRPGVAKPLHPTPRTKSVPTSSRLLHSVSQPQRGGKNVMAGTGRSTTTPCGGGEGHRPTAAVPSAAPCMPSLDFSDEEAIEEILELATRERQFYYDKLRMIERLVVNTAAKDLRGVDVAAVALARSIRDVLYATN